MDLRWNVVLGVGVLCLSALNGCGGSDGTTEPAENAAPTLTLQLDSDLEAFVPGDVVHLLALASDPDNDPLHLSWRTDPPGLGSFADSNAANTTWTAGDTVTSFRIECSVRDDSHPALTRSTKGLESGTAVVASHVISNTTWTADQSPYVLLDDLTVDAAATLTIEPGVRVYLRSSSGPTGETFRHGIVVRGQLQAQGSGGTSSTSVRFLGGSATSSPGFQHRGIRFEVLGSGTLEYVTVADGDVGVDQASTGLVTLRSCRLENDSVGALVVSGATLVMEQCRVKDNDLGIQVSSGHLILSRCGVRANDGAGISITAPTLAASAEVDSCEFQDNGSGHLEMTATSNTVSLMVGHSNLIPMVDGTASVDLAAGQCAQLNSDLRTNYWGMGVTTPSELLALFDGGRDCDAGVASWSSAAGDWASDALVLGTP